MGNGKGGNEEMVGRRHIESELYASCKDTSANCSHSDSFTRDHVHVFLTLGPKLIASYRAKALDASLSANYHF